MVLLSERATVVSVPLQPALVNLMRDCRRPDTVYTRFMQGQELLRRIEVSPGVLGGRPIIRGRRIAVEHVLAMLAAGDAPADILNHYPFLDADDIQACVVYAYRVVARETIEPFPADTAA